MLLKLSAFAAAQSCTNWTSSPVLSCSSEEARLLARSELLGSGLHAPMRGEWGWLGVARMPNGDIVVSDCDHDCVMIL